MSKKVRIGFIGSGRIVRYQMSKLKTLADVEIVGVSDVSPVALDMAK